MSNHVYDEMWRQTQDDLEILTINDFEHQAVETEFDKTKAQTIVFESYLKYIILSKQMEEIYDAYVQPQKRLLVRKLLDCCLGRVLELKYDLVNIDMMEFNYNDEVMEKLRLTPLDVELRIPKYFRREREQEILTRRKTMDDILIRLGYIDEEIVEEKLTELEAIKVIQMHERARQGKLLFYSYFSNKFNNSFKGRLRAQFMKELRMLKEKGKADGLKEKNESGLLAAMKIQTMWRGFTTRKKTRRRKMDEMILIGMVPPSPATKSNAIEESENVSLPYVHFFTK